MIKKMTAMWRTLFTIFYISALVLANEGSSDSTTEVGTCPRGFEREGMYCYHFSKKKTNWFGAIQICKQKDSSLAKPTTRNIDRQLRNHITNPRFKSIERWIDVTYNPKIQEWVFGTTSEKITYDGFAQQQSKIEFDRYCAVMDPRKTYAWIPQICDKLHNYVCQTSPATTVANNSIDEPTICPKDFLPVKTNCYYVGDKKVTWSDATKICKEMNSTLAKSVTVLTDRRLRRFLAQPMFDQVTRWIDVTYNATTHKWVSGTTNNEIPYNGLWEDEWTANPDQYCAAMDPGWRYEWVPKMCHESKYAVCEILLANTSTSQVPIALPLRLTKLSTAADDDSNIQAHNNMIGRPLACPKGFRRGGINCYHVSKRKATWFDAMLICRKKNSTLVDPLTKDLTKLLRNNTAGFKPVDRWIDVTYNEEDQDWVMGTTSEKVRYTRFLEEPLVKERKWHCGVLDPNTNFAWIPRWCNVRRHYVCQKPLGKLREQSAEKRHSLETIKQQETEPYISKTDETLNQNEITQSIHHVIRIKKESSLSLMSAPETEPSVKNVMKSQDSKVPDQPKENLMKPFTRNYRTESRILVTEPSSPLIESTQLGSDSFDTEYLLKP